MAEHDGNHRRLVEKFENHKLSMILYLEMFLIEWMTDSDVS